MRIRLVALAAALLVGACGHVAQQTTQTSGYRLYMAAARQDAPIVALIDTRSHASHDQLPLGTPSADWKHYYTAGGGSLLDIDPETGATQARVTLPGDYRLPAATNSGIPGGLSQNGAWLVLQRFDGSASHLLVFDTRFQTAPRSIDLAGQFQFDAISNDGDRVYLIQSIGNGDYHVRVYVMSDGALNPNFVVDKEEGGDAMTGLKLSGVASHDGQWLFSVYARAHQGAFIHALNLDGTFALCLNLPGTGYADGSSASLDWSLALSPDGSRLYASNPAMGVVTEILTANPSVGRTAHVGTPSPVWPAGAVVSADGHTLAIAGSTGIVWLDASTLTVIGHALDTWTVRSLALSPDGRTLYAVNDRGAVAELSMAGRTLTTTFDPSIAHPLALMRVEPVAA
jgi:hypothetical protein